MFGKYNNNASGELLKAPANFVLSGYYDYSSFYRGGSGGDWWSSTAYGSSRAWYWYLSSTGSDHSGDHRGGGYSVRCVSRQ